MAVFHVSLLLKMNFVLTLSMKVAADPQLFWRNSWSVTGQTHEFVNHTWNQMLIYSGHLVIWNTQFKTGQLFEKGYHSYKTSVKKLLIKIKSFDITLFVFHWLSQNLLQNSIFIIIKILLDEVKTELI